VVIANLASGIRAATPNFETVIPISANTPKGATFII